MFIWNYNDMNLMYLFELLYHILETNMTDVQWIYYKYEMINENDLNYLHVLNEWLMICLESSMWIIWIITYL